MLIFTIRRIVGSILVLLVVSFISFLFTAGTYDPLKPFRAANPPHPPEFFVAMRKQLGLDQPLMTRYWHWLSHLINFDWHTWYPTLAFNFGQDVQQSDIANDISTRLWVTTRMIIGAIILAAILAIVLGVISAVRQDKPFDVVVTILTFLLLALPTFWFAALLKQGAIAFNQHVAHSDNFFYTTFSESPTAEFTEHGWALWKDRLQHLILPVLSLGLLTASGWIRYQRASTIDVLDSDFMRLARAKGLRNRTVIRRHGLRNALIPLVTVMAIDVGALFGGAIITESVYNFNGMGQYLYSALGREDANAVLGWVMVSAIFVILFNLLADLLYAALDPRIRLS